MYYRLTPSYALRSYQRLPYLLYHLDVRQPRNLTQADFLLLRQCDGETEIAETKEGLEILKKYEQLGVISPCRQGESLKPRQQYRSFPNRYFRTIQWAITGRCNYRCRHCFMAASEETDTAEYSLKECRDVVNQIAECGIDEIYLTGGEPLLHPHFLEIVDLLVDKGIIISVVSTNGALVAAPLLQALRDRGVRPSFGVSFDGIGWHDWMRGVPGSEQAALDALALLHQYGFPTFTETNWHRRNLPVLMETAKQMAKLGVSYFKVFRTMESPRWSGGRNDALSYPEFFDACLPFLTDYIAQEIPMSLKIRGFFACDPGGEFPQFLAEPYNGLFPVDRKVLCPKARAITFLDPNKNILVCNAFTGSVTARGKKQTNLTQMTLQQALTDSDYLDLVTSNVAALAKHNSKCRECPYLNQCAGGCRAHAFGVDGDYFGVDPCRCAYYEGGYGEKLRRAVALGVKKAGG